ncbi:unnamed protein product [Gadus morhua 'NCC']
MCTTAFLQIYPVSLDSVFTEILRNRIDRNRNGFAHFGFVWTGPKKAFIHGLLPLPLRSKSDSLTHRPWRQH